MVLKQRFADGRTNYIDLGNDFTYIQPVAEEFDAYSVIDKMSEVEKEDCKGFICYGEQKHEPIYKDFPQWIYSNDGQLFMTLV
jgi:hypothetical protein